MTDEQRIFFESLAKIQKREVNIALCNESKYSSTEKMLKDVTYEVVCSIMELVDGYMDENVKYKITNIKNAKELNEDIELHDQLEEFLDSGY